MILQAAGTPFSSLFFMFLCLFFSTACASAPTSTRLQVQPPPTARLTYVAIGASDTFGTGTDDPATQCWPVDLTHALGSQTRLINLGIPGIDAHDALNIELPVALDAHPGLVTVWLAVNDLVDKVPLASYQRDLDSIVRRLRSTNPNTPIMVANVPDLTLLPRFKNGDIRALQRQIAAYNAVIAKVVQQNHVVLVDLYQDWQALADHPEYISQDGFHPNELGYAQVADIFYHTLKTLKT
ncbi:SGNH/GDSL hydrolase family protein [Dictyobacter halimunensis]